jgi:hypothetical protein
MTNRFLISVAAAALIAGTTGFANAQGAGGMKEGTGSSVQHSAPAPGGAAQSAPQRGDAASEKAGASESKSMGAGKQAEDSVKGVQKPQPSAASDSDRAKGGKDMKAEGRDSKSGTVGQAPAEKGAQGGQDRMNAQSKDQPGQKGSTTDTKTDTNRAQQNQTAPDTNRAQTSPQGGTQSTTGAVTSARVAAPPAEKQTQIVSAIKSERIQETTNVNVNVSIGTVLPASVRFHPLPPRIVEIYPEWRGFEVILIHGRYVIVRPQTREIVYIIEG